MLATAAAPATLGRATAESSGCLPVPAAQTGRPFTVLQGQEISGTGNGQDRATLIAGKDAHAPGACAAAGINTGSNPKPCVDWLNKASFETKAQAVGTFGNTGKN